VLLHIVIFIFTVINSGNLYINTTNSSEMLATHIHIDRLRKAVPNCHGEAGEATAVSATHKLGKL